MSRSLQEYHSRWQRIMQESQIGHIVWDPWDTDLTNESCVILESARSSPMGEGAIAFPDFGEAICYYRYLRVPGELEPQEPQDLSSDVYNLLPGLALIVQSWERRRPKLTNDQLRTRLAAAEQFLDDLLEEFVQQGYQTEMSESLKEIVTHAMLEFELIEVLVLPMDLDALLSFLGNPLADYDVYENEDDAVVHAPVFDLNNSDHCQALKERLMIVGS